MRMMVAGLVAALWLGGVGCDRGAARSGRQTTSLGSGLTRGDARPTTGGVEPGISPQVVLGPLVNPHRGDRAAAATGRQLFTGFNCAGCHSGYAGGGMGPSLRDSLWIYGNQDAQIFSTIAEGRPYGMPAWGGMIPDDQIWQIVTYIRTLGTPDEPVKPPRSAPEPPGGSR
jgi:cytochrome c oxidase cbb3-type subunit 3